MTLEDFLSYLKGLGYRDCRIDFDVRYGFPVEIILWKGNNPAAAIDAYGDNLDEAIKNTIQRIEQ